MLLGCAIAVNCYFENWAPTSPLERGLSVGTPVMSSHVVHA